MREYSRKAAEKTSELFVYIGNTLIERNPPIAVLKDGFTASGRFIGRHSVAVTVTSLTLAGALAVSGIGYATYRALDLPDVVSAEESVSGDKENENARKDAKSLESAVKGAIESDPSSEYGLSKEETVYLFTDEYGTVTDTVVSDWLKNGDDKDTIKDRSDLRDIENVKGEEAFDQKGENLTWDAGGNDIYYQGTTDRESPVGVKITYELDGKEVSAEEIAGKSGKVKIRFDYKNKAKVKVGGKPVTVPFTMVTGALLPTEHFKNVEVSNGQIISEGNNQMVLGFAFPGLFKAIDGDKFATTVSDLSKNDRDFEIPDYVEITADAENFNLEMTLTLAMPDVLSEAINTDDTGLDDLNEKLGDLTDGIDELSAAMTEIDNGAGKLADGAGELADGTSELAGGAGSLSSGASTLASGSAQVANGAGQVASGTSQLAGASSKVAGGTSQLSRGAGKLAGNSKDLIDGAAALYGGASGELAAGAEKIADGLENIDASLSESKGSLADLRSAGDSINEFADGAAQVSQGTLSLIDSVNKMQSDLASGIDELRAKQSTIGGQISSASATVSSLESVDVSKFKEGELGPYIQNLVKAERSLGQLEGAYNALGETIDSLSSSMGGSGGDSEQIEQLKSGASQITSNAGSVKEYTAGTNSLINSMASLRSPISQLATGAENLSAGISKGDKSLVAGASQLLSGVEAYTEGVGTLYDGAKTLSDGSGKLASGAGQVADGAEKVAGGAEQAAGGAQTLAQGAETLAAGADKLDAGAGELASGAAELADGTDLLAAGVDELTDSIDTSEVTDSVDRIKKVTRAGKKYDSFSGKTEDEKGKVRFIIKTKAVKGSDEADKDEEEQ